MRAIPFLLIIIATLAFAAPAHAQSIQSPAAVVLLHHPFDQVDQLGFSFPPGNSADWDGFSARYQHLVSDVGRFDFPYFVADGVVSIRAIPNPAQPYQSTVNAYLNATQVRLLVQSPASMSASATLQGASVTAVVEVVPNGALADPQSQEIHLWVAVSEDPIRWSPPAPVSNGVGEHRFTVRALQDAGVIDLRQGIAQNRTVTIRIPQLLDANRAIGELSFSAWLQADGVPGRFQPHEVVQAMQAKLDGSPTLQDGKGVLVEVYSATWCNPCLFGDLAAEKVAIVHAGAQPLEPESHSYYQAPEAPWLVIGLALVLGVAAAVAPLARSRP